MSEQAEKVQLYVYDLSRGLARQLSMGLLGKQIDAIYHTSIVVGGKEYYFGQGINQANPGSTPFGTPGQVLDLGETHIPADLREEFLSDMAASKFSTGGYNLLENNCNNFSNDFATFLTGEGIPAYITGLPQEILATPLGQMLRPMMAHLEQQLSHVSQEQAFTPQQPAQAAGAAAGAAGATPAQAAAAGASSGAQQPAAGPGSAAAQAAERRAAGVAGGEPDAGPATKQSAQEIAEVVQHAVADTGVPVVSAPPASSSGQQSSSDTAKAAFAKAVQQEFARIMGTGGMTASEAAQEALHNVAAQTVASQKAL